MRVISIVALRGRPKFQGKSSLIRVMGWSAIRTSTCERLSFRIDTIQFCRTDQGIHCSGAFTPSVRAREEVVGIEITLSQRMQLSQYCTDRSLPKLRRRVYQPCFAFAPSYVSAGSRSVGFRPKTMPLKSLFKANEGRTDHEQFCNAGCDPTLP